MPPLCARLRNQELRRGTPNARTRDSGQRRKMLAPGKPLRLGRDQDARRDTSGNHVARNIRNTTHLTTVGPEYSPTWLLWRGAWTSELPQFIQYTEKQRKMFLR